MSNNKEIVLQALRDYGQRKAKELQEASASMDGTQLYAQEDWIPDFQAAKAEMNVLERKAGKTDGFVCKSSAGRVVRLIQNYDSDIYTDEPEDLPAQWAFVWSKDPYKALPFIAISTSPFNTGDCASADGMVYRSKTDNNVWSPLEYPENWELAGPVGGPFDQDEDQDAGAGENGEIIVEWEAPSGSHNAFNKGAKVSCNGVIYVSKINGNIWNPEQYPDFWEVVEV